MSFHSRSPLIEYLSRPEGAISPLPEITAAMAKERGLFGRTPLHFLRFYAHKMGKFPGLGEEATIIKALIAHGLEVDTEDSNGVTALQMAAMYGDTPLVLALLNAGANATHRDTQGVTPLHVARNAAIARMMIESFPRADRSEVVNVLTGKNATPLHFAAYTGRMAIVELLIASGAETHWMVSTGKTALELASHAAGTPISYARVLEPTPDEIDIKTAQQNESYPLLIERLIRAMATSQDIQSIREILYKAKNFATIREQAPLLDQLEQAQQRRTALLFVISPLWVPVLAILAVLTLGQWNWPIHRLQRAWHFIRPPASLPIPATYQTDGNVVPRTYAAANIGRQPPPPPTVNSFGVIAEAERQPSRFHPMPRPY